MHFYPVFGGVSVDMCEVYPGSRALIRKFRKSAETYTKSPAYSGYYG